MSSVVDETNSAIADPELLTDICGEVSAGGTLTKFCAARSLNYKLINRWINDDETRAKRYKLALDIREDHAKDLIIAELIAWLKADVTSCFDDEGNLRAMPEIGENEKRLIAGVKFREIFEMQDDPDSEGPKGGRVKKQVHIGNIIELKFWDKPRSIQTFMQHLAMLVDRKDINVKHSLADLIAGSLQPETEKTP